MIILAIDTSTHACSAAIYKEGIVEERYQYAPRLHGELILPMIDQLLVQNQLTLEDIDAIAFGCGPGSFTGVRLAASVVQGLALGARKPVIGISSLLAMAEDIYRCLGFTQVACAFDARMHEIYWGAYELKNGAWETGVPDCVILPQEVPLLPAGNWVGVGDGWGSYPLELKKSTGISHYYPGCYPHAASIARLATRHFRENKLLNRAGILPTYLRNKVV